MAPLVWQTLSHNYDNPSASCHLWFIEDGVQRCFSLNRPANVLQACVETIYICVLDPMVSCGGMAWPVRGALDLSQAGTQKCISDFSSSSTHLASSRHVHLRKLQISMMRTKDKILTVARTCSLSGDHAILCFKFKMHFFGTSATTSDCACLPWNFRHGCTFICGQYVFRCESKISTWKRAFNLRDHTIFWQKHPLDMCTMPCYKNHPLDQSLCQIAISHTLAPSAATGGAFKRLLSHKPVSLALICPPTAGFEVSSGEVLCIRYRWATTPAEKTGSYDSACSKLGHFDSIPLFVSPAGGTGDVVTRSDVLVAIEFELGGEKWRRRG